MSTHEKSSNAVTVALIGAIALLGANIYATWRQTDSAERQVHQKAQSDLVLEAIKTNNPKVAARNLQFLVNLGLLDDPDGKLKAALSNPEDAPYLPASAVTNLPIGFGQGGFGQGRFGGNPPDKPPHQQGGAGNPPDKP